MYEIKTLNYIVNLIGAVICGKTCGSFKQITSDEWRKIFELSDKHDLSHIIGKAIGDCKISVGSDIRGLFSASELNAFLRCEKIKFTQAELYRMLEDEHIPYIPLKGAVIRKFYPDEWLRTSCDIDVFIKREDISRTCEMIEASLGWKKYSDGTHDVSFFSNAGIHVELHYSLIEDDATTEGIVLHNWNAEVLSCVRENAEPDKGSCCRFRLNDEFAYFYHIAHMAKHFESGGCGIRPFIDLWIMDNRLVYDIDKRNKMLKDGKLLTFADACRKLADVWFSGADHSDVTKGIESFVVSGGVYGNIDNKVAVQQAYRGGKLRYAATRIFLPYDALKLHYPILKKHRYLMPFYQFKRWIKILFKGGFGRSYNELKANAKTDGKEIDDIKALMKKLEL